MSGGQGTRPVAADRIIAALRVSTRPLTTPEICAAADVAERRAYSLLERLEDQGRVEPAPRPADAPKTGAKTFWRLAPEAVRA